jgi:hypothetical protein
MLFLDYYFWIAPHVLLGFLIFLFLKRGLQKRLPIFFSYLVFELIHFLMLFATIQLVTHPFTLYIPVFVFGLVVKAFLKFGIIYELCKELFAPKSALSTTVRTAMRWISGVLLVATTYATATLTGARLQSLRDTFVPIELSANVIFAALLVFLFLFTRLFHISWRSHVAGIALGFGVSAALEVATTALRSKSGDTGNILVDLVQMGAYHICTAIWLAYLIWVPEPVKQTGVGLQKPELELWDQQLQKMVRP